MSLIDAHKVDEVSFAYTYEHDVQVPLKPGNIVRCNLYRPKDQEKHPVLLTYGPYGKDVHYSR